MGNKNSFDSLKGQFEYLLKKLDRSLTTGKWHQVSMRAKQKLIARLKDLAYKLRRIFNPGFYEKLAAGLASLLVFNSSEGQNLTFVQTNPFGINPPTSHVCPSFVDLDADGDFDLFIAGNPFSGYFQENIGTATAPAFGPLQSSVFGITQYFYGYTSADFADLDNDGDFDLIQVSYYGDIYFFENIGTATAPSFAAPVINPFGTVSINGGGYGYDIAGEVIDIDNDGDFDIFVGGYNYTTYQFEFNLFTNIGTPAAPNFSAPTTGNFGNAVPVDAYPVMTFSDVDCDGDLDMLTGRDHSGNLFFYENVSGTLPPTFAAPVPLGFGFTPNVNGVAVPEFVDIDNDGVLELFVGTEYNQIRFHERVCTLLSVQFGGLRAELQENGWVYLDWETHSEQNSDHFLVERSADLENWTTVVQLDAAGTSSQLVEYSEIDQHPLPGDSYYRLKLVDLNGETAVGPSVKVSVDGLSTDNIKVFPNPANDLIHIVGMESSRSTHIELFSYIGQQYELQVVERDEHSVTADISSLPEGVYFLRVANQSIQIFKRGN